MFKQIQLEDFNWNVRLQITIRGSLSIQDYLSVCQNLWVELFDIVCAFISKDSLADDLVVHEISKHDQFLMRLWVNFENVRSNLLNCQPPPS